MPFIPIDMATSTAKPGRPDGARRLQPSPTGTRAVERAVLVLRVLAERGQHGWRISDLAARVRLPLGTCHRILDTLIRERLVIRVDEGARYRLGPLVPELASARPGWIDLPGQVAPLLRELARRHRAVAFLYARSGGDFVCLARENGVEMRALAVERGTRRPLISSSGGAAMLVKLPAGERRAIVDGNFAQLEAFGHDRIRGIRAMLRASTRCGYGLNLAQVVAGVHSIGVAVLDPRDDAVVGAVVVSGASEQFTLDAIRSALPRCNEAAVRVGQLWMST
ncbi:MAG: IclR family transcriptional regulator [Lautropia sp.]